MRLGLFGGSFDPVHLGHLELARCARDQANLDTVWLVPTAVQPHKPRGPVASNEDRVAMLRASIEGQQSLEVSTTEIDRGGVSYTVDTIRQLRGEHPSAQWYLIMGADTLHDLPNWREPAAVLQLATPLVVHRSGEPDLDFGAIADLVDTKRLQSIADAQINMPPIDISSSNIRNRVASGESIDHLVPHSVAALIASCNLYR